MNNTDDEYNIDDDEYDDDALITTAISQLPWQYTSILNIRFRISLLSNHLSSDPNEKQIHSAAQPHLYMRQWVVWDS